MHFLLHSIVRYRCIVITAGAQGSISPSSFYGHFPDFRHSVNPIYLIDESHILFLLFLTSLRPTQQRVRWYSLVCVEYLQMIKWWLALSLQFDATLDVGCGF